MEVYSLGEKRFVVAAIKHFKLAMLRQLNPVAVLQSTTALRKKSTFVEDLKFCETLVARALTSDGATRRLQVANNIFPKRNVKSLLLFVNLRRLYVVPLVLIPENAVVAILTLTLGSVVLRVQKRRLPKLMH
jgi:hypothetical protein